MKKGYIILAVVAALVLILLVSAFVLERQEKLYVRSPLMMMDRPTVTYILGEAEHLISPEDEEPLWESLAIGDNLRPGARVRTLRDSSLDIRFSDRTAVRLGADTIISLDEATVRRLTLNIDRGRLLARFEKLFKEQEFEVRMPTAVAGVRGTELVFDVSPEAALISALSGITEIYNPELPNKRVLLAFQKRTTVAANAGPSEPVSIAGEELRTLQQTINSIHLEKVLLVSSTIQFEPDSDIILSESLPELDEVVKQLSKNDYKVRIDGHTADVGGSTEVMYRLSIKRAEAIRRYLVEKGLNPKRLSVQGFGGTKPMADNASAEGRAQNRRVEFVIVD